MIYYNDNGTWTKPSTVGTTYNDKNTLIIVNSKTYLKNNWQHIILTNSGHYDGSDISYNPITKTLIAVFSMSSVTPNKVACYTSTDAVNWKQVYYAENESSERIYWNKSLNKWIRIRRLYDGSNHYSNELVSSFDGISWESTHDVPLNEQVSLSEQIIYTFTSISQGYDNDIIYLSGSYGVLKSIDAGKTFTYIFDASSLNYTSIYGANSHYITPSLQSKFSNQSNLNFNIFIAKTFNENTKEYTNYIYGLTEDSNNFILITQISTINNNNFYLRSLAYSSEIGIYVASNEQNSQEKYAPSVLYSYDLTNWNIAYLPSQAQSDIIWIPELRVFVAFGARSIIENEFGTFNAGFAYSFDGVNWTNFENDLPESVLSYSFSRGMYCSDLGRIILTSRHDKQSQSILVSQPLGFYNTIMNSSPDKKHELTSLRFGDYSVYSNMYTINENHNQFIETSNPEWYFNKWDVSYKLPLPSDIATDVDIADLTIQSACYSFELDIYCAVGGYITINDSNTYIPLIYISRNGLIWERIDINNIFHDNYIFYGVLAEVKYSVKDKMFYAIGSITGGKTGTPSTYSNGYVLTSTDGLNWNYNVIPFSGRWCTIDTNENSLYIAGAYFSVNGLIYSTDKCQTWTQITINEFGPRRLIYSKQIKQWILCQQYRLSNGASGTISSLGYCAISNDGLTWTFHDPLIPNQTARELYCLTELIGAHDSLFPTTVDILCGGLDHTIIDYNSNEALWIEDPNIAEKIGNDYQIRNILYIPEYRYAIILLRNFSDGSATTKYLYVNFNKDFPQNSSNRIYVGEFPTAIAPNTALVTKDNRIIIFPTVSNKNGILSDNSILTSYIL